MSKSKNIFLTGGNRGIGLQMVKVILERFKPEHLIVTCRDPTEAKELNELVSKNKNLHILQLDVRDTDKLKEAAAKVDAITGGEGINLLLNNSAVQTRPLINSIYELDKESLNHHLEVNTVAPIFLTQAFLPLLEKASSRAGSSAQGIGKATIVNISTRLASVGLHTNGDMYQLYSYRISKTALNMATKCMSLELKDKGILTILMHPGWVKTDLGGEMAPLTVEQSVAGIINVLENLGDKDNGKFLQFDGDELPW